MAVPRNAFSRGPVIGYLLGAAGLSVVGQVLGARWGDGRMSSAAALLFAVAVGVTAVLGNYRRGRALPSAVAWQNSCLLGATWLVGGLTMLAVYLVSGLKWQHGWQYGCGMLLIGGLAFAYAYGLAKGGDSRLLAPRYLDAAAGLVAAQGIAATAGLIVLAASGKLASVKGDWAANVIFVSGGAAIAVASLFAVMAYWRMRRYTPGSELPGP
jgi:hypothetical protein